MKGWAGEKGRGEWEESEREREREGEIVDELRAKDKSAQFA